MARTVTFLQLAPEFGGTRFGPFTGAEIRLGSDPSRNDITLPEALGVAPEHVKILAQTDGSFILAPVDRTASVWIRRSGTSRPRQVTTPVAVQAGDAFSLVTAEGVRFVLQMENDRAAAAAAARDAQGPGLADAGTRKAGGVFAEIKRVGFAKFFTTRIGHFLQNTWRFIATGQIFSPVYIVMGLMMLSGWVMASGAGISAVSLKRSRADVQEQLTNCRDQLGVTEDEGDDPTVAGLTRRILIDPTWSTTVDNDQEFYQAYAQALRIIFSDPSRYAWVYQRKGSDFDRFKSALESEGLPPNLVRVLAFAAARPGVPREWDVVVDSDDQEVCGRGPLGLTYAQGQRLGLSQLQLDAFVDSATARSNDVERQAELLRATAARVDVPVRFDEASIRSAGAHLQGGGECLFVDGPDDRTDPKALARALNRALGSGASRGLPRESEQYWIAARLVKLYTLDFTRPVPDELSFDARQAPSTALTLAQVKDSRKQFAVRQAANLLARAVAVPCLATLDKEVRTAPPSFLWELPNLGSCAIVKAFVEYDQI